MTRRSKNFMSHGLSVDPGYTVVEVPAGSNATDQDIVNALPRPPGYECAYEPSSGDAMAMIGRLTGEVVNMQKAIHDDFLALNQRLQAVQKKADDAMATAQWLIGQNDALKRALAQQRSQTAVAPPPAISHYERAVSSHCFLHT